MKAKRVRNFDTKEEYESTIEAEKITGIRHIREVCNGTRQSAGGFWWEYVDEPIHTLPHV